MARKGNQQKSGPDSVPPPVAVATEDIGDTNEEKVALVEQLPNGSDSVSSTDRAQDEKKNKKKSKKSQKKERKVVEETITAHTVPGNSKREVGKNVPPTHEAANISDTNDAHESSSMNSFANLPDGPHGDDGIRDVEFPETLVFKYIRTLALSVARASAEWIERQKPTFADLKTNMLNTRDQVRLKIQHAQPILFKWITHIGNIMLLLFMVWLDCTLRGIDSFMRMGTTSFFSIVWCGVLSVIAMIGISKFLLILVLVAAVGLFLGFTLGLVLSVISGIVLLWFCGSFWTTGLIIVLGGLAFVIGHDRAALFITSAYSAYCAWSYVGWLGLVLGLNLSFISSDVLLLFLRNVINEQRPDESPDQAAGMQGQPPFFQNDSGSTGTGADAPADRSSGAASTSGSDPHLTSEDEVVKLLNCPDHYAALGLSRFENIDAAVIKREYRKKAMLVHPDKNMGDEKAAEAFKKLQNAYEVLLDSFKRKEYDDELRREELLNYFRKFQNTSHKNKRRGGGFFSPNSAHTEADGEDSMGESRRIACRKCGFLHVWIHTKKQKSRARWCQECKDFHPAKDGDGWLEQSSQPFFFGILQKVDTPSAYVCAGGMVYDATEWYICQGMRCPVNSHKPTFHVNTSVVSKNTHTKGNSSAQRGGGTPAPNIEETMTEEEFFEWLQNAAQSGAFENFAGSSSESPSGFSPKTSGANNYSNSSSSKRKKKGKK